MRIEEWRGPGLRDRDNLGFRYEEKKLDREMNNCAESLVRLLIEKERQARWQEGGRIMLSRLKRK